MIKYATPPLYETPVTLAVKDVDAVTLFPDESVADTVKVYVPADCVLPLLSVPSQVTELIPEDRFVLEIVFTVLPLESLMVIVAFAAAPDKSKVRSSETPFEWEILFVSTVTVFPMHEAAWPLLMEDAY